MRFNISASVSGVFHSSQFLSQRGKRDDVSPAAYIRYVAPISRTRKRCEASTHTHTHAARGSALKFKQARMYEIEAGAWK